MSSSADRAAAGAYESARAGDVIAGFRLERLLGRSAGGAVYEATQESLGRRVALRLIDPALLADRDSRARLDRELGLASSLHHAGLVPLFEAGEWAGGRFVAMRLVRGRTLSSLLRGGGLNDARAAEILQPVTAGVDAAHRAGLSHGAVRAENVLIDRNGSAYLADLGLGRGAGADADREQLAALRRELGASTVARRPRARPVIVVAAIATVVLASGLLLARGSGGGSEYAQEPPPGAPEGTVPLGSALSPGAAGGVGCGERLASASSCTLVPADADRIALRASEPGVIRGWAVRGASGELTLQVLRPGMKRTRLVGFSQPVEVPDPGPHSFAAEIGFGRGEIIAVRLAPGAELGRRANTGAARRWAGAGLPLPRLSQAEWLKGELLIRVDVEPGGTPPVPAQLTGRRAQEAPAGATLAETTVSLSGRSAVRVRLVQAEGRIQLDAIGGSRRTARLPLSDAEPEGQPILFEQGCGHPRSICLRWLNPGEDSPLLHEVRITPDGRFRMIG